MTAAVDQEKTGLGNYFIVSWTKKLFYCKSLRERLCDLELVEWKE